eukprot:1189825-Prorocentrum_minimum.AAC.7
MYVVVPHQVNICGLVCLQGRKHGETGVWVGDRKIGACGVRISKGIRYALCICLKSLLYQLPLISLAVNSTRVGETGARHF